MYACKYFTNNRPVRFDTALSIDLSLVSNGADICVLITAFQMFCYLSMFLFVPVCLAFIVGYAFQALKPSPVSGGIA